MTKKHNILKELRNSNDPAVMSLVDKLLEIEADNARQAEEIKAKDAARRRADRYHIKTLKDERKKLQNDLFGTSSEKYTTDSELNLEIDGDDDSETANIPPLPMARPTRKPRGRRGRQKTTLPTNLDRVERFIPLGYDNCQKCGGDFRPIKPRRVETLAAKSTPYYVKVDSYEKACCRKCRKFAQAKALPRLFPGQCTDNSVTATTIVGKFADVAPLNRQSRIARRSDVTRDRATLSRQVIGAAGAVKEIVRLMHVDLLDSHKLHMDETRAPLLVPGLRKRKLCYTFVVTRDDEPWLGNRPAASVFFFAPSRHGKHAERYLTGFSGVLQTDAFGGYNRLTRKSRPDGSLLLAYCMAHMRRKFVDVTKTKKSETADEAIAYVARLYAIEKRIRHTAPDHRESIRQLEAVPIWGEFIHWLERKQSELSTKSRLGEAIAYALKHQERLSYYLSDGRVEIDNNSVERTIRLWALVRRVSLFAGSEAGGHAWATMASIVDTCDRNQVDPHGYLLWVFDHMSRNFPMSQYGELLPWNAPAELRLNLKN